MCGFKHVTNEHLCSNIKCQWLWRIWRLLGIERCCVMPLFEDVVVDFEFVDLSHLEIMCIYNIWYWLHWMWLWDVLFYMCGKCYFAKCCCPKVKMVKHGKTMHNYALCHLDSQIYSFFVVVLVGLGCMLWWQFSRANIMLIWGWSSNGWHMWCFTPLLEEILVKTWFFPKCTK
jgi:hypothetical protein